jgi:hypothetical protein
VHIAALRSLRHTPACCVHPNKYAQPADSLLTVVLRACVFCPQQFCENISKNVLQAESAAAAMQGLALAHAYQNAAVAQAAGAQGAATAGSSSSNGGGGGLSLASPPQVVVAGQQVAAADQAYRAPVSLPQSMAPAQQGRQTSGAAAAAGNGLAGSSSNSVSGQQQQQQQRVVLDSWAAAAVSGQLSGGSAASMGSREYEPAAGAEGFEASEASGYWQSSVAAGAMAGDSEDYPF